MNAASTCRALFWLVRDTFGRARAGRLFWVMLAGSAVCILLCLSVGIEGGHALQPPGDIELYGGDDQPLAGPNPRPGHLSLGFGLMRVALYRDGPAMVHFLQVLLAMWVAGAAGTLLALIWTAGFLPDFLRPDEIAVLLTKPVSRRLLIWGQALGSLCFVSFQAAIFVGGTWLALGLRTGVWAPGYLWSFPLLCLHFAMIYAVSAALAVWTRNTTVAAIGAIAFWLVCFGINSGRNMMVSMPAIAPGVAEEKSVLVTTMETAYWGLPKPVDIGALLEGASNARGDLHAPTAFGASGDTSFKYPALSVITSLLFAIIVLECTARAFRRAEY